MRSRVDRSWLQVYAQRHKSECTDRRACPGHACGMQVVFPDRLASQTACGAATCCTLLPRDSDGSPLRLGRLGRDAHRSPLLPVGADAGDGPQIDQHIG